MSYALTNLLSILQYSIPTAPTNDAFAALPEGIVETFLLPTRTIKSSWQSKEH